ncbi:hypothetical protein [Saccharicrinis fermentans]|uniref:hypothetical protein n=1 Tax=Saccharicrinis fermentans TaxID=982 RepID=UPI0012B67AE1|nr:hypothetical protein [Saccharicrinis fermentans]
MAKCRHSTPINSPQSIIFVPDIFLPINKKMTQEQPEHIIKLKKALVSLADYLYTTQI